MPLNALSSVVVATTGTPPEFDWSAEIEKNLTAVERIGKMLIAERFKAKKGPGADLALMSREVGFVFCFDIETCQNPTFFSYFLISSCRGGLFSALFFLKV